LLADRTFCGSQHSCKIRSVYALTHPEESCRGSS
jgi:hypothetical protein